MLNNFNTIGVSNGISKINMSNWTKEFEETVKSNNFTIKRVEEIKELDLTAHDLVHNLTGARYLHLQSDDHNNCFCITFKTPAFNSTGLQHVLEHMSLCGSQKYPCRDPFFRMLSRSVSSFMNAMTFPDHTSYPFTTINEQDFYNLADVYTDAVFKPLLRYPDFLQEGWRLEHDRMDDPDSEIVFKGVVYNEMKGCYSSTDTLLFYSFLKNILPSSYPHENGGHPLEIPNLQYSTLKEYHAKYYHPSNSCFFTYGNIPIGKHLKFFDNILQSYDEQKVDATIGAEPEWREKKRAVEHCPLDPMLPDKDKQVTITIGYRINTTDIYDQFVLSVLDQILLAGPNAIFYPTLIEPHFGLDYSPLSGVCSDVKYPVFCVGLKGIYESDENKIENIIYETFNKIVEIGIDDARVNDILNSLELFLRHNTVKRGLILSLATSSNWTHDHDPVDGIRAQFLLNRFKSDYAADPDFLINCIKRYFINNKNVLVHVMKPDPEYHSKMDRLFQQSIGAKLQDLSSVDRDRIFQEGIELNQHQETAKHMNDDCLPTIRLADMSEHQRTYDIRQLVIDSVPVQFCLLPTNGITYFSCLLDVSNLPYMLKSYLPIFAVAITNLGAGEYHHKAFASRKERFVRDMRARVEVVPHHTNVNEFNEYLYLSSYCLNENVQEMTAMWVDIFNKPHLENQEVILTILLELSEKMTANISDHGHHYAKLSAASNMSYGAQLCEKYEGLSQIEFIKQLAMSKNAADISEKFIAIASYIMDTDKMRCAVNTTKDNVEEVCRQITNFIGLLPSSAVELPFEKNFSPKLVRKFVKMPFEVNFVSKALPAVAYIHSDYAPMLIMCTLSSLKFLHPEIREKGGAYGAGLTLTNHVLSFYSYRDPNAVQTLKVFENTLEWISSGQFTDEDLEEAQVRIIGNLDKPIAPSQYGKSEFVSGVTFEMKQSLRDSIFKVKRRHVCECAQKYLSNQLFCTTIIGKEPFANIDKDWDIEDLTI